MTTTTAASTANSPFPKSSTAGDGNSVGNAGGNSRGTEGADVLGRVVQGAHDAVDRMAESAAPAVQKLQEGVQSAGDSLNQHAQDARNLGEEWCEGLRSAVRDHPLAAVATALAVGVLLTRLSR